VLVQVLTLTFDYRHPSDFSPIRFEDASLLIFTSLDNGVVDPICPGACRSWRSVSGDVGD
jgi:hypothetical protein